MVQSSAAYSAYCQSSLAEKMMESFHRGAERSQRERLQILQHQHEMALLRMKLDAISAEQRYEILQSASAGNAGAQYQIGILHLNGEGGVPNYGEALRWLHLSADQGFADAQAELGHIYRSGVGIPVNLTESANWFRLAAAQYHADAQFYLGLAHLNGEGVVRDSVVAFESIKKAAEMGSAIAQHFTGIAYYQGIGTTIDGKIGLYWLQKAAAQGLTDSYVYIGSMYAYGGDVAKNDTTAISWFARAIDQGGTTILGDVLMMLGETYENSDADFRQRNTKGVPKQFEAYAWFNMAAELGYTEAQARVKDMRKSFSIDQRIAAAKLAREYWDILSSLRQD